MRNNFNTVFIIPTGIGASIGGYAGDASPYVNLLSKVSPVITNPNAVNAAGFSGINPNVFYTEGYALDMFFKAEIALRPSNYNKIGIIFDKSIPQDMLNVHINTINAVKSTYGLNIIGNELTDEPVGVNFSVSSSGISTGNVNNPETLIQSAKKLINKGAQALAVVCYFQTPEDDSYSLGEGVDPVGGVEAVISHILTRKFNVPVAHAPAFSAQDSLILPEIVNSKAAAEYITPTFLPCILLGLYNAPQHIQIKESNIFDITLDKIGALIMPYNSLGCIPVLKAIQKGIPVIAVKENSTVLDVTAEKLGISTGIIHVENYFEAVGRVLGIKEGIYF